MTRHRSNERSPKRLVLLAATLLAVLAGSLALRTLNTSAASAAPPEEPRSAAPLRWTGPAPAARVPEPRIAKRSDLDFPRWGDIRFQPAVRYQTDLDLIAPLGDGPENAALWFADFARPDGARLEELRAAQERAAAANRQRTEAEGRLPDRQIFAPDDPLLLEAEPWVDQATMRFYPDVWGYEAWETKIPNLLFVLSLAKSWVARGDAAEDLDTAMEDYRRAIRLGRLVRQDDFTLISDLVGLACTRFGLEALYARLLDAGRKEDALIASLALGEAGDQRLATSERFTTINVGEYLHEGWLGFRLEVSDDAFGRITAIAESDPDRRFRLEAILLLNLLRFEGTREQRDETLELLGRLAEDGDAMIAEAARWALETRPEMSKMG